MRRANSPRGEGGDRMARFWQELRSAAFGGYSPRMPASERETPKIHLIDALPYVFRAYHSLPESITDPEGVAVNAVHGFSGFLLKLLEQHRVTHIALTFDESLTTSFRNELYPDYKSSRPSAPPEFKRQIERCRAMGEAMGMRCFAHPKYEADDLIATLCRKVRGEGADVVVVTSDKDLAQLVEDHVELCDFAKGVVMRAPEVEAKFGVPPDRLTDYLGLCGDSVDDIPGVAGVGAKTAAALIQALGDLDHILGNLDAVRALSIRGAKSIATRLENGVEIARLSKHLATVVTDIELDVSIADLRWSGPDQGALEQLCAELGFKTLPTRAAKVAAGVASG